MYYRKYKEASSFTLNEMIMEHCSIKYGLII